jgi:hypothetical protein
LQSNDLDVHIFQLHVHLVQVQSFYPSQIKHQHVHQKIGRIKNRMDETNCSNMCNS